MKCNMKLVAVSSFWRNRRKTRYVLQLSGDNSTIVGYQMTAGPTHDINQTGFFELLEAVNKLGQSRKLRGARKRSKMWLSTPRRDLVWIILPLLQPLLPYPRQLPVELKCLPHQTPCLSQAVLEVCLKVHIIWPRSPVHVAWRKHWAWRILKSSVLQWPALTLQHLVLLRLQQFQKQLPILLS